MVVVPHGADSSMFEVYSESGSDYTVSLREPVGCTCLDFQHRRPRDGCKHIRRVRLEFGIDDLPTGIRSEHAALTDVELARRRRGIDLAVDSDPESETDPTTVKGDAAPRVVADGGREIDHKRMVANELACQLAEIDGVEGFDEFCTVVEEIQRSIRRAWDGEERRQIKQVIPAYEREFKRQAATACEQRVASRPAGQR